MTSDRSAANPTRKRPTSLPAGCLTLFGLPFAVAGISVFVQGLRKSPGGFSRDTIMMLMAGLLFSSVGLGIIVFSLYVRRAMKQTSARQQLHPAEPWLWREDWADRTIRSNQRTGALFMLFFALFWNGISWTVATAFFLERRQTSHGSPAPPAAFSRHWRRPGLGRGDQAPDLAQVRRCHIPDRHPAGQTGWNPPWLRRGAFTTAS